MISVQDFIDLVPNNFTMEPGSNNLKYFEAFTSFLNRILIDIEAETTQLLSSPPAGSDHAGIDKIGSAIGINRQGLNNQDYANLIKLYRDKSDYYRIGSWENIINEIASYGWIQSGSIDAGRDQGVLLDGTRNLTGEHKLLGGRRVNGRFVPNVLATGELTFFLRNPQEDKKIFIEKFLKSREPFGAIVRIEYTT